MTAIRSARAARFLFEGELPVLNIGTNDGLTCDPEFARIADGDRREFGLHLGRQWSLQGRLDDAALWQPETGVHAIQMEIAQSAYLAAEDEPWTFDADKAAPLRADARDIARRAGRRGHRRTLMTNPRHNIREIRSPRGAEITAKQLDDRGGDADADEQSRPGRRGEPERARRLWRDRAGGADMGRISTGSSRA